MSDYDERDENETDRSEDEEDDERIQDLREHKYRLGNARKSIKKAVKNREAMLAGESTRKPKLTEEDVDQFFAEYPDLTQEGSEDIPTPTLLHAIVDQVQNTFENIESVSVKALVQRLVKTFPRLLCISNDEKQNHWQNPLYLAITHKKKMLVDYMVVSCPEGDSERHLTRALEDRDNQRKNCLHLAFEKDMKPTTLLRMLKAASTTALEAVDTSGRRPMHYAVQYKHCNVEVIRAFIERDHEIVAPLIQVSEHQPPKTFLDEDEKAKTSVYREHVLSVPTQSEERSSTRGIVDHKKIKQEPPVMNENQGKMVKGQRDEVVRGRIPVTQSKHDPKTGTKLDDKLATRVDQANTTATRELRNTQDRAARPNDGGREKRKDDDDLLTKRDKIRDLLRQQEAEARLGEVAQSSSARDMSRDRQSLVHESVEVHGPRDPPRIQTTLPSAGGAQSSSHIEANTPKMLRRIPTMLGDISGEKLDKKLKQTSTATKKPRKPVDHEAAARDSKFVLRMLKLHYMRTRSIERATKWLYKTNPHDIQTFFDYQQLPQEVKEGLFKQAFKITKFDEVLQFVHFTDVTVIRPLKANSRSQRSRGGVGRQDMEFFFEFLHQKGVRYILKVVVEENGPFVHSDEAIKNALDKMIVEHLDWRKVDLDPQIICGISSQADDGMFEHISGLEGLSKNQLRKLDLRWSGNSAVLRAWSEPQGLPSLQHLDTVNLIVPQNTVMYDSPQWIEERVKEFERRLNECHVASAPEKDGEESLPVATGRKIAVHLHGVDTSTRKKAMVGSLQSGLSQGQPTQSAPQKAINTHEWLKCIDGFATSINPLWSMTLDRFRTGVASLSYDKESIPRPMTALEGEVVVALIDDGVALLDQTFVGRVLEGKTFDYRDGGVGQSYNSAQGHGTEMARCILRVCPMAKIYPIRLKTHSSADGTNEIDLESAALALNAALEKDASIISMSWTIPVPKEHPAKHRFEEAVRKASERNVLMFCSSGDEGHFTSNDYPSAVQRDKIFRIGAANDDGLAHRSVGTDVDFLFPGVKVNVNATKTATGSSVATALAAGLAATIIYCFKMSALAVKTQTQTMGYSEGYGTKFTEGDVNRISKYAEMRAAFEKIGRVNTERFIQVWDELEPAASKLENYKNDYDSQLRCIVQLCTTLMVPELRGPLAPRSVSSISVAE